MVPITITLDLYHILNEKPVFVKGNFLGPAILIMRFKPRRTRSRVLRGKIKLLFFLKTVEYFAAVDYNTGFMNEIDYITGGS